MRAYYRSYGLPVNLSYCSNYYGPYQYPEKLIRVVITSALACKPIPVYGDGRNIRDWLFVEDHRQAIERILQDGVSAETYNIGGESEIDNLDLVGRLCAALDEIRPGTISSGYRSLIKFVSDRPGHDQRYAMNITKIRTLLEWHPRVSLDEGLRRTVARYLDRPRVQLSSASRNKP
jgi:dTDP-glucose 4,6-dehydratase